MLSFRQRYGVGGGLSKLFLIAAALLFCSSALAQQQPDLVQQLARDLGSLNGSIVASDTAQQHVVEELRIILPEYARMRKHLADLNAYLKACGDKPGCTVPVASVALPETPPSMKP